jgi:hypothetical protein
MVENSLQPYNAADLEITPKEISDEGGMLLDNVERAVLDRIKPATSAANIAAIFRVSVIVSLSRPTNQARTASFSYTSNSPASGLRSGPGLSRERVAPKLTKRAPGRSASF